MKNSYDKSNFLAPVRYGILNQFVGSMHADLFYSFLSDWAPDSAEEQTRKVFDYGKGDMLKTGDEMCARGK